MPFELSPTSATLQSVTPRTETHGEDRVFAISLGIKITGPNTMLDKLSPTLRTTLYKAVEGQEQLPGVEESTPLLRCRGIEELKLAGALEGWTLTVDHGIDDTDPITLGACKVDKFRVCPSEGGSVDLLFRVGSNDIDATEAGLLCSHLSQEITITLSAPAIKTGPVIDGSTEAFQADHPDAGDLFAQQHGDATEGQDGGEQSEGEPGANSDGTTDPGVAEQAELEAGMAASLAAAGVKPKGRRSRAAA